MYKLCVSFVQAYTGYHNSGSPPEAAKRLDPVDRALLNSQPEVWKSYSSRLKGALKQKRTETDTETDTNTRKHTKQESNGI